MHFPYGFVAFVAPLFISEVVNIDLRQLFLGEKHLAVIEVQSCVPLGLLRSASWVGKEKHVVLLLNDLLLSAQNGTSYALIILPHMIEVPNLSMRPTDITFQTRH